MSKGAVTGFKGYFQNYIALVNEDELPDALKDQLPLIKELLLSISEEKSTYAYAAGKWTLKEMLQHIIDAERIFAYRALCFARKDKANLPGFEENDYASNSNANKRTWQSLIEEFFIVRKSTELLFESFSSDVMSQTGVANNTVVSVEMLGFLVVGHLNHHKKIIEERYL